MKSILDRGFRYTPAVGTDVAKTIKRVQRAQQKATLQLFLYMLAREESRALGPQALAAPKAVDVPRRRDRPAVGGQPVPFRRVG